jgi:Protein of unknown function (DUF2877)
MTLHTDSGIGWDTRPRTRSDDGPDIVVPILRSGVVAREFCRRAEPAEVDAVFERSFYLRSGDLFVCVGEPTIGNGPLTLIADFGVARSVGDLGLYPGQPARVLDRCMAIGDSLKLTFDHCVPWRQPHWPPALSLGELNDLCGVIARRVALESPPESLGRISCDERGGAGETPLARIARPRIARFESWLSSALVEASSTVIPAEATRASPAIARAGTQYTPRQSIGQSSPASAYRQARPVFTGSRLGARPATSTFTRVFAALWPGLLGRDDNPNAIAPIADLVGLGPGLTPSGDDFLVGALALLDALSERKAHAALARAIAAMPRGLTSPLSECLLKTAAAGHLSAALCCAVSAVVSGVPDQAIAAVRKIGHGSGWDMLVGILTALSVVTRDARA